MTLDRTPAHFNDMLAFVRKLHAIVGGIADVPRCQIFGPRNILANGCEQVDHETLYRTSTTELAAVERALAACLASRGGG